MDFDLPASLYRFERFLDQIEDPDPQVLVDFQKKLVDFEPEQDSRAACVIGNEEPIWNPKCVNDGQRDCVFKGCLNEKGRPTGDGILLYPDKSEFRGIFKESVRTRKGIQTNANDPGTKLYASWKNGQKDGYFRLESSKGGWEEGFYKLDLKHGYYRAFGPSCWNTDTLTFFGIYKHGRLHGICYKGLLGGGYLIGRVDKEGKFTAEDIIFMYPDFRSAIKGKFNDGVLEEGKFCFIIGSEKSEDGLTEIPVCSKPDDDDIISYDPSTSRRISSTPLIQDPWEKTMVEVKESEIPSAREGLFAKRDIEEGIIFALFQGVKLRLNISYEDKRPPSDYRIRLNGEYDLDIPDNMTSLTKYCATLGHKANHSFTPNSEWTLFEHPRFGLIRALSSLQDIPRGQEILINYNMPMHKAPDWYKCLWLRHMRETKGWSDQDIQAFIDRQQELTGKKINLPESSDIFIEPPEPSGITDLDKEPDEQPC